MFLPSGIVPFWEVYPEMHSTRLFPAQRGQGQEISRQQHVLDCPARHVVKGASKTVRNPGLDLPQGGLETGSVTFEADVFP